jgi:hypothetical protein
MLEHKKEKKIRWMKFDRDMDLAVNDHACYVDESRSETAALVRLRAKQWYASRICGRLA